MSRIIKSVNDFLTRLSSKLKGGGEQAIEKQKKKGKNTARERVEDLFLDRDSFLEIDLFVEHSVKDFGMDRKDLAGDGVITGFGTVNEKPVAVFAQDFTVAGGSLGRAHAKKIVKVMDGAAEAGIPLIGINDSGGARIQEGVESLCGYGEIFYRNTKLSGRVPQISVILGPCAGGAVYSPALTDFVFVVDKISKMFITGPQVIKTVLGEEVSHEELGGAMTHASITGNAHFYSRSEEEAFDTLKKLLSFLPANSNENPPRMHPIPPHHQLEDDVIPDNRRQAYSVKDIIRGIVDGSDFLEVHEHYARNMVVGFARLSGRTIGIVANQPRVLAGVLDVNASDKAARFIRFCDSFNIP
ncbi:MAG: methylmalonyl-CoA carboxyltransferase, partial [Candidatus Aegiribacteria sp.]|nr:methylmalonyl-CoA carboxyltransferase [Candidatus Aegiribacteria sp.]MBD3294249.1 methylmalonyl-CoA carboxyltransferase [Candidatus Fermentibacteria bacterium]